MHNANAMHKRVYLVTGARAPVALDWARRLRTEGSQVYAADCLHNSLAGASASTNAYIQLPPPATKPCEFAKAALACLKQFSITHVLPTCEEVYYWAALWQIYKPEATLVAPSLEALRTYHSKFLFPKLLAKIGLNSPQTRIFYNKQELELAIGQQKRYVLKPEFSRFATKVFVQNGQRDISWFLKKNYSVDNQNTWVVQDFIEGTHFCSYAFATEGQLKALAVYEARYRTGENGACYHFEAVKEPQIKEFNEKFVRHENFTGQVAFDFIKDEQNGFFYAIECNPRATSGLHLLPKVPFWHSDHGITVEPEKGRAAMLSAVMLTDGLKKNYVPQRLGSWFKAFQKAQDIVWLKADPKPYWIQAGLMWEFYQLARTQKTSLLEATTTGIAWAGEEIHFAPNKLER